MALDFGGRAEAGRAGEKSSARRLWGGTRREIFAREVTMVHHRRDRGTWRHVWTAATVILLYLAVHVRANAQSQPIKRAVTSQEAEGTVHLGPREIPIPALISSKAQSAMKDAYARPTIKLPEATADRQTWKRAIAAADRAYAPLAKATLNSAAAKVEPRTIGGVTVYVGRADAIPPSRAHRAILYIHGGAFILLADGPYAEGLAASSAALCRCTSYSVNYRAPPDYPFPAALDDIVAVYRELLKSYAPRDIAIEGESAGGNLAAAATLKIRDLGLPMPAMAILLSPAVDLTVSGDSHRTNLGLDAVLKNDLPAVIALYGGGQDLRQPYLSPVFGDFNKGFPPTFIKAGGREILLSDAILMHRALRRAGIEADLEIWEGMSHGPFSAKPHSDVPEDQEVLSEIRDFLGRH